MTTTVYWSARDLDSSPFGNHHFILILIGGYYGLPPLVTKEEGAIRFVTMGGFKVGKNLEYQPNNGSDVYSVRELLNPKKNRSNWQDYDLERNKITAPGGNGLAFAEKLVQLAQNYKINSAIKPVSYNLSDYNCSCWVNTMFKVAGVTKEVREKAGEFSGIDWGEEDLLDEDLFKP